ncbi:hypothetical protein PR202_ga23015 [Eleusine coracana subsp. coracana]|uniref:BTB domain-containing protein n=1 Tax=Eleusine coracana subsp. coracana TaxID=191504 RepID=A0AAV5D432_ELECO|nr:hypothetical protein QOZ80_1AG0015000 [Eleusine coracana subsp. coracana]GJN05394.1 hypothetical protein PR202_ga23015 [Eleusine coracana subsp. coracana]
MQSPVFKAELYGPMMGNTADSERQDITVEDMEPDVFKALLTYIYTDSLPSMDDLEGADKEEMVKHLLVAADRYGMERMKLECESVLCESLDVDRVAATLALADQHHCNGLKDVCIEFMNSSNRMDDVVATQGYKDLKRSCPAVVIDVLERATKSRKI